MNRGTLAQIRLCRDRDIPSVHDGVVDAEVWISMAVIAEAEWNRELWLWGRRRDSFLGWKQFQPAEVRGFPAIPTFPLFLKIPRTSRRDPHED